MYPEPDELEESQITAEATEDNVDEDDAQLAPGDQTTSEAEIRDSVGAVEEIQAGTTAEQGSDPGAAPGLEMPEPAGPSDDAQPETSAEAESSDSTQISEPAGEAQAEAARLGEAAVSQSGAQESAEPSPDQPAWFVVHCYSGYENKVRHNLEQRIETMGMKDKIFDVVIPTQEEIEVKEGKRRTVERHIFPGYVLVNMILSEESWYVVRNTPGVTGFVGMGTTPTPLRPEEVNQIIKRMEAEAPRVKASFKVGERVRIIDGPFNDFRGTVAEIDSERTKVRVMVSMFGRDTPVELDFLQVERL